MEPSVYDEILLYNIQSVLCKRYETTCGIKKMGMHNRSGNGHSAWITLCDHPTPMDTDTDLTPNLIPSFTSYAVPHFNLFLPIMC
jgi:hypothetical protein